MSVVVITPPPQLVTVVQALAHLRVDDPNEITIVSDLIDAAGQAIDGPSGWLGRAIGLQTLELRLSSFVDYDRVEAQVQSLAYAWRALCNWQAVRLPYPPLVSVAAITYDDVTDAPQTLDPSLYVQTTNAVRLARYAAWPANFFAADTVRIQYVAGYAVVPAPIRHAVLLLVGHYYNNREAVVGVENRDSSTELPLGVQSLLAPYRVFG